MPQTLLAVCAILVFSFFALNQHKANERLEQAAIGSEIELAATDVARDQLTLITSFAYDEADVGSSTLRSDVSGLSAIGPDGGESDRSLYDDIDDFHNYIDTLSVDWYGQDIEVMATAEIRYVDPDNPDETSASPTLAKEVAVTVAELESNPAGRAQVMVRLIQVLTPAWQTIHG
ncbi:MAG: hypothetical protein IH855_08520 [Bacteroidetes bacterium]|nr:hypothetical protein [Bacteroidota bacterium]